MALKILPTPVMIELSSAWTDPKRARKTLEKHRLASGLVADLDKAHKALMKSAGTDPGAGDNARRLQVIQGEEDGLDEVHDRKARGTHQALTAIAELTDDPETRKAVLTLREVLFPDGLEVINASYVAEAGHAQVLEAALTPELRKLLDATRVSFGRAEVRLLEAIEAMIQAGKSLGLLEHEKAALLAAGTKPGGKSRGRSESASARSAWIRVVHALVDNLLIDEALPEKLDAAILAPLRQAEQKADRAASRNSPDPKAAPEPPAGS